MSNCYLRYYLKSSCHWQSFHIQNLIVIGTVKSPIVIGIQSPVVTSSIFKVDFSPHIYSRSPVVIGVIFKFQLLLVSKVQLLLSPSLNAVVTRIISKSSYHWNSFSKFNCHWYLQSSCNWHSLQIQLLLVVNSFSNPIIIGSPIVIKVISQSLIVIGIHFLKSNCYWYL